MRAAHAAAVQDRTRLLGLLEPVDVLVATMRRAVDEAAGQWAAEHASSIASAFSARYRLEVDGRYREERPSLWDYYCRDLRFADLCALAPELVKARLEQIVRSHSYDAGPAMAERPAAIEQATARIIEVERQHEAFVDAAASLTPPVRLELLPPVRERREREAARAQREASAREAEERLNASRAARPRGGQSQYLAENSREPFA